MDRAHNSHHPSSGRRQATDFYQLEAKRLEPGEHPVPGGLVGKHNRQDRAVAARPGPGGQSDAEIGTPRVGSSPSQAECPYQDRSAT